MAIPGWDNEPALSIKCVLAARKRLTGKLSDAAQSPFTSDHLYYPEGPKYIKTTVPARVTL
jgi:hypothetical protein